MRQRITKLLATVILLSVCGSVYGLAEVWACQTVRAAGLSWENQQWVVSSFVSRNYLLRLEGENSSYAEDGTTYPTECNSDFYGSNRVRCHDNFGGTLIFDTQTGQGGLSFLIGAVTESNAYKDSIVVRALQCTKF